MAEEICKRPGLRYRLAKGVVFVRGDNISILVDVLRDIPVVVVGREVEVAIERDGEQPSDTTSSLKSTGDIRPPEVLNLGRVGRCATDCSDGFVYQVPAIIDKSSLRCRGCLPYAPIAIVVFVADEDNAIGRDRRKAVRGVVGVSEDAVVRKVSVEVVEN